MRLFVLGFLEQERGERERENFCLNFLRLFFYNFLTFFTFSLYFSISFFSLFLLIFHKNLGGGGGLGGGVGFIGVVRKWEASISVSGYTSASCP